MSRHSGRADGANPEPMNAVAEIKEGVHGSRVPSLSLGPGMTLRYASMTMRGAARSEARVLPSSLQTFFAISR